MVKACTKKTYDSIGKESEDSHDKGGKTYAVCGPHLQTSFAEEVDQTPARRVFEGVCFPKTSSNKKTSSSEKPNPPSPNPTSENLFEHISDRTGYRSKSKTPVLRSSPIVPLHLVFVASHLRSKSKTLVVADRGWWQPIEHITVEIEDPCSPLISDRPPPPRVRRITSPIEIEDPCGSR
ncbi:hypothetical protein E3N88_10268 [Mikania micrantha]|uniref:Uncharacterized protein n=1 Tax=Mikania micrantha TaxID=192012 RepID=A0A5N6PCF3_9ASTR|nr:hypothetical protein E3N88_10268 [Mikania micrantha]